MQSENYEMSVEANNKVLNKEEMQRLFESWNWSDDWKIKNLPNLEGGLYSYLDIYFKDKDANKILENIKRKVMRFFEEFVKIFYTRQNDVTLYNHKYTIDDRSNQFFWENSKKEIFYIRPASMIEIFSLAITFIENKLFKDSIQIKEMSSEEEEKYYNLLSINEEEAYKFRTKFYTSLKSNSSPKVLEKSKDLIIESIADAFKARITKQNHNGNKQLNDDIVKCVNIFKDFFDFKTIPDMKLTIFSNHAFDDKELFEKEMQKIQEKYNITHIITSGTLGGVEKFAIEWANKNDVKMLHFDKKNYKRERELNPEEGEFGAHQHKKIIAQNTDIWLFFYNKLPKTKENLLDMYSFSNISHLCMSPNYIDRIVIDCDNI